MFLEGRPFTNVVLFSNSLGNSAKTIEILSNLIEINEETEEFEGFLFEFGSSTVDDVDGRDATK